MKTVEQLAKEWNAEADYYNQWCNLSFDEMIDFAEKTVSEKQLEALIKEIKQSVFY